MLPQSPGLSPAVADLGLGGSSLADQAKTETEEERKKRIREMQQRQLMGDTGSLAAFSLLGGGGARGPSY